MVKINKEVIVLFFVFCAVTTIFCIGCPNCHNNNNWPLIASKPYLDAPCDQIGNKYKLMSLLNLLCNNTNPATSPANLIRRDGCYGCFFRAVNYGRSRQVLIELNSCTKQYLNISGTPAGTNFMGCATELNRYTTQLTATVEGIDLQSCYQSQGVICQFLDCVREQNGNALMEQCYQEVGFTQMDIVGRRNFFSNMTKCVLGRVRCSRYNPISGELQQPLQTGFSAYALQITKMGLLRVFKIPMNLLHSAPNGQYCSQEFIAEDDLQASYSMVDGIC